MLMIAWSYDLLSEAEKMLLRRLSVFGSGYFSRWQRPARFLTRKNRMNYSSFISSMPSFSTRWYCPTTHRIAEDDTGCWRPSGSTA